MHSYIRFLLTALSTIVIFIVSHKVERYNSDEGRYPNYLSKTRKNYFVKLVIYIVFVVISLLGICFLQKHIEYFIYFCIAFGTKGLYQLILCALALINNFRKKIVKKSHSDSWNEDFEYCDSILMLNLVGVVIVGVFYYIMRILNSDYLYINLIGNMLSITASLTFFVDSYSLYAEFAKKDNTTIFYRVRQKEWNLPDRIYLGFHCFKCYFKEMTESKEILIVHIIFALLPIIVIVLNKL